MDRRTFAATALGAAASLAGLATITPAEAAMPEKMQKKLDMMLKQHPGANKNVIMANMARVQKEHLVRCYGVNAIGRNDCASGSHSCAGQATRARDPDSFVLLPEGDCQKLAGGSLKPGKA